MRRTHLISCELFVENKRILKNNESIMKLKGGPNKNMNALE